jgi:NTP pyrophosphatase (non-canonical NTP hydrolase)
VTPTQYRNATLAISGAGVGPLDADDAQMALYGLGIAGEAGEVADVVKKILFHGKPFDDETKAHLLKEIGDVVWYADRLLMLLGLHLDDAMRANVEKLRERYPDGWDAAANHYDHAGDDTKSVAVVEIVDLSQGRKANRKTLDLMAALEESVRAAKERRS